ncbi:hypothetical protein [Rahnella aceris]|jgi:hypothetical protein|uniref:hypothetical protein n=1 Tax=Rahnella sp. (strain Y9602) TaxID=2703885 RepID=UPI001C255E7C|nr:hypothetical protein [Rahnella aceris]MBU9861779.1 hypothetical protein [Rahnella aceris]
MTIVKKNHLPSLLVVFSVLCITVLTTASVRASTIPSPAEKAAGELSIPQACGGCVSYDVSVWMFTPTRPDALKNILQSLNTLPEGEPDDVEGQRVISPDKSTVAAGTFRQSGTLEPLVLWHAMSIFGEPLPLESVSSAGTLRAELNMNVVPSTTFLKPSSETFNQKILSFTRNADNEDSTSQIETLLNFKLIAGLPVGSGSGVNDIASSSGRVLIKNGGALLNVNRMGNRYLVWVVHAAYIKF